MPMWRCPHCGTPQAETSRCWVCRRSSTTCSTCRHFQRSLAANVGFCGLDRRRLPLTGSELRGCWAAGTVRETIAAPSVGAPEAAPSARRGFVPVEPAARAAPTSTEIDAAPISAPVAGSSVEGTLFGEVTA